MKHATRSPFRHAGITMLALVTAAALLGVGSHLALAGNGHPRGHHQANHAEHFAQLAAALGLSDQQKAAARKLHQDVASRAAPLREQARLQHEEVEALLDSGSADAGEVGQRMIEMYATHKKLEALHEQTMARMRAQLSAEQRAKLDKLSKEHAARGGHAMGGHGPCSAWSFGD